MQAELKTWLLEGDPWVRYNTRRDLLGEDESTLGDDYEAMATHPLVSGLIHELEGWPGKPIASHKSAGTHLHKLTFLADIGLRHDDHRLTRMITAIREHRSTEGPLQMQMNIPTHFGGKGIDEWAWDLCDAPSIHYALHRMGIRDDDLLEGTRYMINLVRDNGWPCAASEELGSFKGPGPRKESCPYATLVMLKNLAVLEEVDTEEAQQGIASLLNNWENSRKRHPFIFYMGTDFRKLKAPLIWYDIVHVVETLSHFPFVWGDGRFQEMVDVIRAKADDQDRYTPESIWIAWKVLDSGQKKEPSRWLTFLVNRMLSKDAGR